MTVSVPKKAKAKRVAPAVRPIAFSYIRFSTPEQLKGDSQRRQRELSEAYADKHGFFLDDSLKLRDLGVSAFRGKNRTQGALASFLQAVESGRVARGSYLLVESLDRLSRDLVTEALTSFLQIINAGIVVVTLADEMVYSKQSLDQNMGNLMMSLVIMARAHEESATKSKRLSAAWAAKRRSITEVKLTSIAPGWLRLSPDRKSFIEIPERVKLVRRIFEMTLQGHGKRSVTKTFNREGIPAFGNHRKKGVGWHDSYIQKILTSRAVIGEFQSYIYTEGKRTPSGEPISNYFPAIIEEHVFRRVNSRPVRSAGPVGAKVSNLFTGLAFDGETGASMHYADKGTKKRGAGRWRYLVSDYRRLHPDAPPCFWIYPDFEELALRFVRELDWSRILNDGRLAEDHALEREVDSLKGQVGDLAQKIQRIVEAIQSTTKPPAALVKQLQILETDHSTLEEELKRKSAEVEAHRKAIADFSGETEKIKTLALKPNDIETRLRLREELRRKIKRIDLFPKGLTREWQNSEYRVRINSGHKVFSMTFRNGITRWVVCIGTKAEALTLLQVGEGEAMRWMIPPLQDGTNTWTNDGPLPPDVLSWARSPV